TEFIVGPNPVFTGGKVSIGTDEYSNATPELREGFRHFADYYLNFVAGLGKQPCMWGSLSHAYGDTPVRSEGVLMNAWYNGYANPDLMIEQGYDLVSINDGQVYIVPAVDYYQDYLDCRYIYEKWTPAHVGARVYEENHPKIKGGMFAVWNDHACNGIGVGDIEYRTQPAVQAIGAKCWSGVHATLPYGEYEAKRLELSDAPGMMMAGRTVKPVRSILSVSKVKPGMRTGVKQIGYKYTVKFDVEVNPADKMGTVLFEDGTSRFYLMDPVSGMIGFSRDGYLYRFNFAFYPGEKASVMVKGDRESTSLYINGKHIETLKRKSNPYTTWNGRQATQYFMQTLVFPLEKAGAYKSKVSNLEVIND
ncbi:MAG: beta-N-acetylhexosaminidase, partial [Bacteroidales bacterium]|nr:beta-N-acetylhexosaminidase [Bacteroidales bacterium]